MPPVAIPGTLQRGMNAANTTLPKQWTKLTDHIPALRGCFPATINVNLVVALLILNPENTVPPFEWEPGHVEGFGFLEIKFEWPLDTQPVQAWLYLPQHSAHRYNMLSVEVITKEIRALREITNMTEENVHCRLHLS